MLMQEKESEPIKKKQYEVQYQMEFILCDK